MTTRAELIDFLEMHFSDHRSLPTVVQAVWENPSQQEIQALYQRCHPLFQEEPPSH